MNKKKANSKNSFFKGKSEMLLLIAIMTIGVGGLTFSYSGRNTNKIDASASATDTTSSDGKVKSDRMILHLNQKNSKPQQRF